MADQTPVGAVRTRFGWCSHGDKFHGLCRGRFTSGVGVLHICDCPEHEREDAQP